LGGFVMAARLTNALQATVGRPFSRRWSEEFRQHLRTLWALALLANRA